jgi:ferric-chelate reductase (NADPH)
MPAIAESLMQVIERVIFLSASVSEVIDLNGHFRLIELRRESLKHKSWIPGQKVQFHLGNFVTRTYTPTVWDADTGSARFLVFLHGNGPGSRWAKSLRIGDLCHLFGPRDSLNLSDLRGPVVFFGDETSVGVAEAPQSTREESSQYRYVFEVSSIPEAAEVLGHRGLTSISLIQKSSEDKHLAEVENIAWQAAHDLNSPEWLFTGRGRSIQNLKNRLRTRGISLTKCRVKVYWVNGKTGLD